MTLYNDASVQLYDSWWILVHPPCLLDFGDVKAILRLGSQHNFKILLDQKEEISFQQNICELGTKLQKLSQEKHIDE
jgi:hypothetical protein